MSKITDSARGQACLIRIPGVCNRDPETTVFCHEPKGSGLSMKWPDTEGCYGCSDCHDLDDGRTKQKNARQGRIFSRQDILVMYYEAARRTRILLIDMELIKL